VLIPTPAILAAFAGAATLAADNKAGTAATESLAAASRQPPWILQHLPIRQPASDLSNSPADRQQDSIRDHNSSKTAQGAATTRSSMCARMR
jgi:hypothetical protein